MTKRILLTGATDGIGLETAKKLVSLGHHVLLHGRNGAKLNAVEQELMTAFSNAQVESYTADLSRMSEVVSFAKAVLEKHDRLDVLINNAGVFNTANPITRGWARYPFRREHDCPVSTYPTASSVVAKLWKSDQPLVGRSGAS